MGNSKCRVKRTAQKRGNKRKPSVYKCQKTARISRNGYLNFLREFKKSCCGLSPQDMVRKGAKAWNKLSCSQKEKYKQMYFNQKSKESNKKCADPKPKPNPCPCAPVEKKKKQQGCKPAKEGQ